MTSKYFNPGYKYKRRTEHSRPPREWVDTRRREVINEDVVVPVKWLAEYYSPRNAMPRYAHQLVKAKLVTAGALTMPDTSDRNPNSRFKQTSALVAGRGPSAYATARYEALPAKNKARLLRLEEQRRRAEEAQPVSKRVPGENKRKRK